jgi:hypothetical protein
MLQCAQAQRSRSITRSSRTTSSMPPTQARPETKHGKRSHTRQKGALRRTSHPRPSTQLKHTLRQAGLRCHGGDSGIVKTHIHVYYTFVTYTYKKCYMGFCTPRRTIMDSKKKKTVQAFYENIPGSAEVGDGTWACTVSRIAMLLNRSPYNDISPFQCDLVHNIWRYRIHNVSGHFQRWLL